MLSHFERDSVAHGCLIDDAGMAILDDEIMPLLRNDLIAIAERYGLDTDLTDDCLTWTVRCHPQAKHEWVQAVIDWTITWTQRAQEQGHAYRSVTAWGSFQDPFTGKSVGALTYSR